MGHSSMVYGAHSPTPQSGQRDITLWAANDFSPAWHHRSLKYNEYDSVTLLPPGQKIIGGVTHGWY